MFCIIVSILATGLFGFLEVDLGLVHHTGYICFSLDKVFCVLRFALAID